MILRETRNTGAASGSFDTMRSRRMGCVLVFRQEWGQKTKKRPHPKDSAAFRTKLRVEKVCVGSNDLDCSYPWFDLGPGD